MEAVRRILAAGVLVAVAGAIAPLSPGVRKAIGTALSLCFLLTLLSPAVLRAVPDLFSPLPETDPPEATEALTDALRAGVEDGITEDLCARFSLFPTGVRVTAKADYADGEITVKTVSVRLLGRNITADAVGLMRYCRENYGAACEILYGAEEETE